MFKQLSEVTVWALVCNSSASKDQRRLDPAYARLELMCCTLMTGDGLSRPSEASRHPFLAYTMTGPVLRSHTTSTGAIITRVIVVALRFTPKLEYLDLFRGDLTLKFS